MNDFHQRFEQARDKDYWRQLNPSLHITDESKPFTKTPLPIDSNLLEQAKESLRNDGYFQLEKILDPALTQELALGVERIYKAGWPTPFVVVYDEYWELFHSLQALFEAILGKDYKQVPNFWCWYVDADKNSKGWGHHRDRPSVNTVLETGLPATLTTWIPLTTATTANGCIYIVPSGLDPNYPPGDLDRRDLHELQSVRALPANQGDVLGWTEALLHWGSRSSNKAKNPRVSISFTFQRADQNAFETPLFEPSNYMTFDQRLGLIAQNVCNYQAQAPTTAEILFACRRLAGLIPTIDVQDGQDIEVIDTDKVLSDSIIWELQREYFEKHSQQAWKGENFSATNKMTFVEAYSEIFTAALVDCANFIDYEHPLYILELGGGTGCFAYRFLHELAENKSDFESLKKLKIKYILSDFSEAIVDQWKRNKNLVALTERGILDFAVVDTKSAGTIKTLLSNQTLTSKELKNPLVVIANHVFDTIEQDAFRCIEDVVQEAKITLRAPVKSGQGVTSIGDIRIAERFIDLDQASRYQHSTFDAIVENYRTTLGNTTFTFPIGALRCIEQLSELSQEKLILLSADRGDLYFSPKTKLNQVIECDRDTYFTFNLNFDAISRYFQINGGTAIVDSSDYQGLRLAFHSTVGNYFQQTKHFFKHYLSRKNLIDAQNQITEIVRSGLQHGNYDDARVGTFLAVLKHCNYDPDMFSFAHKILLDERYKELEEMSPRLQAELTEAVQRTIRNIYITNDDYAIYDSVFRLYIQLDWFEECLKFCEEVIQTYGQVRTAIDHAALSCESLKKYDLAYKYFEISSTLRESNFDWARAGMIRAASHLRKDGDSVIRFTIARPK